MARIQVALAASRSMLALLVLVGAPVGSAWAEDLGPAIGTTAPDIGTRLDQAGKPHQLSDLMGKNGLGSFSLFDQPGWRAFIAKPSL